MLEPAVRKKIEELIQRAAVIAAPGAVKSQGYIKYLAACNSWIVEVRSVIDRAIPIEDHPYKQSVTKLAVRGAGDGKITEIGAILSALLVDSDAGLISDFGNKIRAETFDDFLEHADIYRQEGQKQAAGVLAGVVFEDTIRRICRDKGITEKDEDLDKLISTLARQTVITGQQARQARTAAFVRTKATHAQWDEYELDGVAETITLTRALLATHLGG